MKWMNEMDEWDRWVSERAQVPTLWFCDEHVITMYTTQVRACKVDELLVACLNAVSESRRILVVCGQAWEYVCQFSVSLFSQLSLTFNFYFSLLSLPVLSIISSIDLFLVIPNCFSDFSFQFYEWLFMINNKL